MLTVHRQWLDRWTGFFHAMRICEQRGCVLSGSGDRLHGDSSWDITLADFPKRLLFKNIREASYSNRARFQHSLSALSLNMSNRWIEIRRSFICVLLCATISVLFVVIEGPWFVWILLSGGMWSGCRGDLVWLGVVWMHAVWWWVKV